MKIRFDFVTNSSSSSFIMIGNPVNVPDLMKDKNAAYFMQGHDFGEGTDVVELDDNMVEIIKENKSLFSKYYFFESYINFGGNGEILLEELGKIVNNLLSKKIKKLDSFDVERSQHSTTDLKEFCKEYLGNIYET